MRWKRALIALLAIEGLALILLLIAATGDDPQGRATALMALGLVLIWVIGFGAINVRFGERLATGFRRLPGRWPLQFVLGCVLLAMLEEIVTTGMSNLAGPFGDETGEAKITASTNYFEVVLLHSVIVFAPMFYAWTRLLRRWDFSPFAGMLCFGVTGLLAEISIGGPVQIAGFGMWILVYGLMVYAPLRAATPQSTARPPVWAWPYAVALPFLWAIPVALLVLAARSLLN